MCKLSVLLEQCYKITSYSRPHSTVARADYSRSTLRFDFTLSLARFQPLRSSLLRFSARLVPDRKSKPPRGRPASNFLTAILSHADCSSQFCAEKQPAGTFCPWFAGALCSSIRSICFLHLLNLCMTRTYCLWSGLIIVTQSSLSFRYALIDLYNAILFSTIRLARLTTFQPFFLPSS